MRKKIIGLVCVILFISFPVNAWGLDYLPLSSPSVILMEQTTGKVLFGKNEQERMYPASMTKMLTAITALDYLSPEDILVVGTEIYGLPGDSMMSGHFEGEWITVENLMRALMIRSGNETGCVLALNAIRAKEDRSNIPYSEAEKAFCTLMNQKARELGAINTHFTNPHGLHDDNHYTTAYDLALIARAYMENDLLRRIAAERSYTGDSLGGLEIDGAKTKEYNWVSHNELLLEGANAYPYATGIKTGFTDQASQCLAASATKRDLSLITVVFYSPDPGRWQDTKLLFDYGFETFAFETIQEKDTELETAYIANPRLGDDGFITVLTDDDAEALLSAVDFDRLTRVITYNDEYLSEDKTSLNAPIEKDAPLGTVAYMLDGTVVFEGTIRAGSAVEERTFDTDMDYYIAQFKENIFSLKALPYWFGGIGTLIGIIGLAMAMAGRRSRRRSRWHSSGSNRRYRY